MWKIIIKVTVWIGLDSEEFMTVGAEEKGDHSEIETQLQIFDACIEQ